MNEYIQPDEETFKTMKKKNRLIKMSLASIEANYSELGKIDDFTNISFYIASQTNEVKAFPRGQRPNSCRSSGNYLILFNFC